MGENEVLHCLKSQQENVQAVCISGGEPTLQYNLEAFIKSLKEMGFFVKINTAGCDPQMINNLIENERVDYISLDIKNSWEEYYKITQMSTDGDLKNFQESLRLVQASDIEHEYNTTILPAVHEEKNFFTIAGYLNKGEKYYIQRLANHEALKQAIHLENAINIPMLIGKLRQSFPELIIKVR